MQLKERKLLAENITKSFRKFTGGLNIQIDGNSWIELKSAPKVDEFLKARNNKTLDYVVIDENKEIIEIKLNKKKEDLDPVMEEVRKIYRHG